MGGVRVRVGDDVNTHQWNSQNKNKIKVSTLFYLVLATHLRNFQVMLKTNP